ncbi:SNW1 isoform 3 [Pan troglodytes]|uniref:SNW1 isoform 3 n=1 Tax=Pan troglodytes TaxID=9598 RepID=A0A2J8PKE0_PANTR|nr:SNW1 isoform 3 [Pan troglodytes]
MALTSYLRTSLRLKKRQDPRDRGRPHWSPPEENLPRTDTGKAGYLGY